jgi:hypothetical protein
MLGIDFDDAFKYSRRFVKMVGLIRGSPLLVELFKRWRTRLKRCRGFWSCAFLARGQQHQRAQQQHQSGTDDQHGVFPSMK